MRKWEGNSKFLAKQRGASPILFVPRIGHTGRNVIEQGKSNEPNVKWVVIEEKNGRRKR